MNELKRNCPKCNKEITYSRKDGVVRANKENRLCYECTMSSANIKNKISLGMKRAYKNDPTILQRMSEKLKGRKLSESHIKNRTISQTGLKRTDKTRKKISESQIGKKVSQETRAKQSISAIKRLKKYKLYNKPNFNPKACEFIDRLNNNMGFNLKHALNGGEVWLNGFYPDGYDKDRNIIFEYDEKWHNSSKLKEKDLKRQEKLINEIKPSKFIRYDENNNKLYDAITNADIPSVI